MRAVRIIRAVINVVLSFIVALVPIIALLSAFSIVQVVSDPTNIEIPAGEINSNFDIFDPSNTYFEIPFSFTNSGDFDLTDFSIGFDLVMFYNSPQVKSKILDSTTTFPLIAAGATLNGTYRINGTDFKNLPSIFQFNYSAPISFLANITISASYAFRMFTFSIRTYNLPLSI